MNTTLDLFDIVANYFLFAFGVLTFTQNIILLFWLLHVVYYIYTSAKRWLGLKRRIEGGLEGSNALVNKLYFYKETTVRYAIFLILLLFEIGYFLDCNLDLVISLFFEKQDADIQVRPNCTLSKGTIATLFFNLNPIIQLLNISSIHGNSLIISFLWMYAVLMLHLTDAASGKTTPQKKLVIWIVIGFVQHIGLFLLNSIPWIAIFALMLEPIMSQFNFIVAAVLARRFRNAMKSRVNMAYHTRDVSYEKQQRALLRQYKILIPFSLGIFEIFYLIAIPFYYTYALLETILFNSCLFYLPKLTLSDNVVNNFLLYRIVSLVFLRFIETFCYMRLCLFNIILVCKFIRSKCKHVRYRYHVGGTLNSPLLN